MIAAAYLRLLGRYELTYRPLNGGSNDLRVRVEHQQGGGESGVARPPAATAPPSPSLAAPLS